MIQLVALIAARIFKTAWLHGTRSISLQEDRKLASWNSFQWALTDVRGSHCQKDALPLRILVTHSQHLPHVRGDDHNTSKEVVGNFGFFLSRLFFSQISSLIQLCSFWWQQYCHNSAGISSETEPTDK